MAFIVPNESRPDIAATIKGSLIKGAATHVASKIFAIIPTQTQSGIMRLAQKTSVTATKGREYGTKLEGSHKANKTVNYTCTKVEARVGLDDSDIVDLGGIDAAILAAAESGAESVLLDVDKDAYNAIKTAAGTAVALDATKPFAAIGSAANAVKHYGEPTLVCSEDWLVKCVSNTTVAQTLRGDFGDRVFTDLLSGIDAVMHSVGLVFGVKHILIADSAAWEDATTAFVIGIRDPGANALLTAKSKPVFGVLPVFIPTDGQELDVATAYDASDKINCVDTTAYLTPKVVNADGAKAIVFPETW